MKTHLTSPGSHRTNLSSLTLIGALLTLAAIIGIPFFSSSSASSSKQPERTSQTFAPSEGLLEALRLDQKNGIDEQLSWSPRAPLPLIMPQAQSVESIATFAGDCLTPKSSWNLGEVICAKVLNTRLSPTHILRRIQLVNPAGFVTDTIDVTTSNQNSVFTLPTVQSYDFFGLHIDNRGTWRVHLTDALTSNVERFVPITVHDPALAVADLQVSKFLVGSLQATAGSNIESVIWVFNAGPDTAQNPRFTDVPPSNTTFQSLVQTSGPTFTCSTPPIDSPGTTDCTRATLDNGAAAGFVVTYKVNNSIGDGTDLTSSVSVASDTFESSPGNNNSDETATSSNPNPPACTLSCSDNIIATANTSEGGQSGAHVTFSSAETTGTCGTLTASPASGAFFPVGATTVTVTASTGGTCSFTVTVIDTAPPTISCPAAITATALSGQDSAFVPDPNGSSSTVGTPTATGSNVTTVGVRNDGQPLTAAYSVGTTLITWTATDDAGRTASCTQSVRVNSADVSISCPTNVTVTAAAGDCAASVNPGAPTASPATATVTGDRSDDLALNAPYAAGVTTITWTATTADGGTSSCVQTITVNATDTTPPTLHAPPDVTVTVESCSAVLDQELGIATADDNCLAAVSIERTGVPTDSVFQLGTTVLTYTATDGSGNVTTKTQNVTVHENTPPTITAPANATFTCPSDAPDVSPSQATASDNCSTPTVTVNETRAGAGSASSPLVITRTFTATDAEGNTADAVQTITVIDNVAPTVTLSGANPQIVECHTSYTELGATANDNCDGSLVATPSGTVDVNVPGDYTITYTATDAVGNAAIPVTRTVSVRDTTPPTISCPANIVVYLPADSTDVSMPVIYPAVTANDSCSTATVTTSVASGSVFPVGLTTVIATATDAAGITSSCSFTVTVLYNFSGFFSPVDNLPVLNVVNAGRAIPIKFNLSGDKGLNIFAPNSPFTVPINCNGTDPQDDVEETSNAGSSSLSYSGSQYIYTWKTQNSWIGTCRQLVVRLNDGSEHRANFKFR